MFFRMEAGRLRQIEEIYHAALDIPFEMREAFFDESCGADEDLRREVISLLSFENTLDRFLDAPPETLVAEMVAEKDQSIDFIGREIGHYKVVSLLGKGGMGAVYLADDTKLDRRVALKILPSEFSRDKDRMRRFVREARSASVLNHPNIITIHEIGESNGTHFIATEFIDGKTLNQLIREKKLDLKSILEIAIQAVSALDEAHTAGIIHRDIKPDNIMIRASGLVKVLDFGLAKNTENKSAADPPKIAEDDQTLIPNHPTTQAGMIMGTPNYMSPEQARGKDIDRQTDIFSFGVVLYEMLCGENPFDGETVSDIIAAVLTKEPPALRNIPAEFAEIVGKTLQKDKARRYQTIHSLLTDLKEFKQELEIQNRSERFPSSKFEDLQTLVLDAPTTELSKPRSSLSNLQSIAVLPFTNMSADTENEYFCDGLAEDLLIALSKIDDLKVAARTSAFSFKGKDANISEIGEKLSVKNVLEGSVRRAGNRLRISVQLVNAAEGFQVWSERYDREMKDIFELQDEITLSIIDALKLKLLDTEKAAVLTRYTENAEAYELFLKGRYHAYKYTAEGWTRAIEFFAKAIEIQPDYAPAYADMASAWGCLWFFGILPAEQVIPEWKSTTDRALEIDENISEVYLSLGLMAFFYYWEWEKAEQAFKKAIEINPNNAEAISYYAMFLAFEERFDEASTLSRKALKIDPLAPLINMNVGWNYFSAGMPDKAASQADKMIEIESDFHGAYWLKGAIYLSEGEYEKAIGQLKKAVALGAHPIVLADLGAAYSLAGNETEAARILEQLLKMRRTNYVPAICLARIYSRIGENEKAIEWLEEAFEERNGEMVFLKGEIAGAAEGDSLHGLGSDPRLIDLLRKMNLP